MASGEDEPAHNDPSNLKAACNSCNNRKKENLPKTMAAVSWREMPYHEHRWGRREDQFGFFGRSGAWPEPYRCPPPCGWSSEDAA